MRFEDGPNVPDHFYRNHLPHFDPKDAPYSVSYRLHGSIPMSEIKKLRFRFQSAKSPEEHSQLFLDVDQILHRNGPYFLREPAVRTIVMDSLAHLDGNEIQIYAYCVMPNHVHAVFDLATQRPLYRVMQSHKAWTGRLANQVLDRQGLPFWKRETYDEIVRKGRLGHAIVYTIMNPVIAGLVKRWEDWPGTYLAPGIEGFATPPRG